MGHPLDNYIKVRHRVTGEQARAFKLTKKLIKFLGWRKRKNLDQKIVDNIEGKAWSVHAPSHPGFIPNEEFETCWELLKIEK